MSYYPGIDLEPISKKATYINETWIADCTIQLWVEDNYQPKDLVDASDDNIRVYVPLDICQTAVMRRLRSISHKYREANEGNEIAFESEVCTLISQIEIHDQTHYVRVLQKASIAKRSADLCANLWHN